METKEGAQWVGQAKCVRVLAVIEGRVSVLLLLLACLIQLSGVQEIDDQQDQGQDRDKENGGPAEDIEEQ